MHAVFLLQFYVGCFWFGAIILALMLLSLQRNIGHVSSVGTIHLKALISMLLIDAHFFIIGLLCLSPLLDKRTMRSIIAVSNVFVTT